MENSPKLKAMKCPVKHIAFLLACSLLCAGAQETSTLKLNKTIPLPGVKGRFDHFAIDVKGRRLFVAALGNNTLEVLDVEGGKCLKTITGLSKPTGVLYLAEVNQIGVANGDEGTFKLFDGDFYTLKKTVSPLEDADNARFDRQAKVIYVGYGTGALGIIDPGTARLTGSIKLPGHPESFQLEQRGNRIFVNVPDAGQISVIERLKGVVAARWPLGEFKANFPMALDEAHSRLFIGCRQPARLLVLDTASGKKVADLTISGDTDDLFYDAARKQLYLSCGEGFIDVIDQQDADHYRIRERIRTAEGARTSFFSTDLNEFYLAVPLRGDRTAEIRVYRPQP